MAIDEEETEGEKLTRGIVKVEVVSYVDMACEFVVSSNKWRVW